MDNRENLYIFVSFDLVNSTEYKVKNKGSWIDIFKTFYNYTTDCFRGQFENSEVNVWKYVGDEILYYISIKNKKDLYECLNYVDETLIKIKEKLDQIHDDNSKLLVKSVVTTKDNTKIQKSDNNKLLVKSAVWLANTARNNDKSEIYNNVNIEAQYEYGNLMQDFLGSDVDVGFRISKHVTGGRIVVSAELAYLLITMPVSKGCKKIDDKLRIVDYQILKGIWDGRAYPIIWYCDDWNNIELDYDEHIISSIICNIKYNRYDKISVLQDIYEQLNKKEEIEYLVDLINDDNIKIEVSHPHCKAEIHLVAIVIDENASIFIAKRSNNKNILPGKWEFGCSQLPLNYTFEQSIKDTYKKEFGIEIVNFDEDNVIGTYRLINGDSKKHGIIFYAETDSKLNNCKYVENKHSEIKWIKESELDSINDDEIVEDGKRRMMKVFSIWNNKRKE